MKDNNNLIDLIKEKKYNIALNEMEYKIKEELGKIVGKEENFKDYSFIKVIEASIIELPGYYDLLTHIRNLYFFSDKSDEEKLNELTNIYSNLDKL